MESIIRQSVRNELERHRGNLFKSALQNSQVSKKESDQSAPSSPEKQQNPESDELAKSWALPQGMNPVQPLPLHEALAAEPEPSEPLEKREARGSSLDW